MVHTNAITNAYVNFLEAFHEAVERHARALINNEVLPVITLNSAERDTFVDHCRGIAEDGWYPAFGMIDAAEQERAAIAQVFPGIPIRMCQYHLVAACRKKFCAVFGRITAENQDAFLALQALRQLQRCPHQAHFDEYYHRFRLSIEDIDRNEETWRQIDAYMMGGWLSWRWRESCMDYGLPVDITRDGPWSTNNFVESAFQVFDRIFLDCRANKR